MSRARVRARLSRLPAPRVIRSASNEADAAGAGRVVDAAGRDQEVERRRAHVLHALGQQGQSVGEGMLVNEFGHGIHSFCGQTGARVAKVSTAL